jgi:hypothetical protein
LAAEDREPRIIARDLIAVLNENGYFAPRSGRDSLPLAPLAERAESSTKTLSKLLRGEWYTIDLGLADRICVTLGEHLSACGTVPHPLS